MKIFLADEANSVVPRAVPAGLGDDSAGLGNFEQLGAILVELMAAVPSSLCTSKKNKFSRNSIIATTFLVKE